MCKQCDVIEVKSEVNDLAHSAWGLAVLFLLWLLRRDTAKLVHTRALILLNFSKISCLFPYQKKLYKLAQYQL